MSGGGGSGVATLRASLTHPRADHPAEKKQQDRRYPTGKGLEEEGGFDEGARGGGLQLTADSPARLREHSA